MIRKAHSADVEALGPRSIRVICSTDSVDMMGDVVVQTGADFSVFKRNPIVLFSHNPEHPIGTATNVGLVGGKIMADIEFAPEGVSKKADEICALVKGGILKSVSIGFDPTESEPLNPSRPRGPQKYLKWTLCEISVVAIPANAEAIVTEKAMAVVNKDAPKLKFKGLYDLGRLAGAMSCLNSIHAESVWEEAYEGDDSEVPAKLANILHSVGEALIAMTQEEVAECLACVDAKMAPDEEDEIVVVDGPYDPYVYDTSYALMSTEARIQKFRQGRDSVTKSGKAVSKATGTKIQDALDSHDLAQAATNVHTKCMKALTDMVPAFAQKTKSASEPGISYNDAGPVIKDLVDSHQMVDGAMKMHSKCMKGLSDMVNPDDSEDSGEDETPPANKPDTKDKPASKGLDLHATKELRMKQVRLLAVSPA